MDATIWSLTSAAVGSAIGFVAKAGWDAYSGYRDRIRTEAWKIRTSELDQRLSQFYWPLHMRLKHDDLVWQTIYRHLRPDARHPRPEWAEKMPAEKRASLALRIEQDILIENHKKAVEIIRAGIHRANADEEFENVLARYLRHVDAYLSLRSAGIDDILPSGIGEPFPKGLSAAVEERLRLYQAKYEVELRERDILDLSGRAERRKRKRAMRRAPASLPAPPAERLHLPQKA
jgi:hypothetical protein